MNAKNAAQLPPETPVWIYLRHSPGDNQSIEAQEAAVVDYVEQHGWKIQEKFIDKAASGSNAKGRKSFSYMIYLASQKPRPADAIIIWEYSRFARNQNDSQLYRALLRSNGWHIISIKDDIPDGPMSPVFEALTDYANESLLEKIRLHTRNGLRYIAEQGCVPNGPIAVGYKVEKKNIGSRAGGETRWGRRPVLDPDTAPLVEQAFELKANGATNDVISEKTGLFKPKSGSWNTFFRNTAYVGKFVFDDKTYGNIYPPIVSEKLFAAVQKRIPDKTTKMDKKHHPRRKGSSYFLANVAVCGYCGSAIEGKRVGKYRYYVCAEHNTKAELCPQSKVMPADALEEEIIGIILNTILAPEYLQELLVWTNEKLAAGLDTSIAHAEQLRQQLADAEKLAIKYARNFGMMETPTRSAEQLLREQDDLVSQLRQELTQLEFEIENSRITTTMDEIEQYVTNYRELLKRGEYFDLRYVTETLLSRIVLFVDDVTVELAFPEI